MRDADEKGGLVDLQVNGFAGVDFNSARLTANDMDIALAAMLRDGVTMCLPTLITATPRQLTARLAALDTAVAASRLGSSMVPGYHLEGPFLNPHPAYAGCHPPAAMRTPDANLIERLERNLRRPILLITLAPELAGAEDFIRWAVARGKIVGLGHTGADAGDVARAVAAGARLSTHLGNALSEPIHKFHNPLMAQLAEDSLFASFIADGIHIPPSALRVFLRAKGSDRAILVTDATSAAATASARHPARFHFAGMGIDLHSDGTVRVPGGTTLAGSALTLGTAVRNVVGWRLVGKAGALRMARDNPGALLGPALRAHNISLPHGTVAWTDSMRPATARVGDTRV